MNKKIYPAIGVGIAVVIAAIAFSQMDFQPNTTVRTAMGLGISYEDANLQLKENLKTHNISMSSPIKVNTAAGIAKYCQFFDDEQKQRLVEYCTSTELRDKDSNFLGNINLVGTPDEPRLVMGVVQLDPYLSQKESAQIIFSIITEEFICDCWYEPNPEGVTMEEWADAHVVFHIDGKRTTSQSKTITLYDKLLKLEMTTNTEGYLWKFLVSD